MRGRIPGRMAAAFRLRSYLLLLLLPGLVLVFYEPPFPSQVSARAEQLRRDGAPPPSCGMRRSTRDAARRSASAP